MHREAVSAKLLEFMGMVAPIADKLNAVLAGGTSLALQLGHRTSADLDFFTQSSFNNEYIISEIGKNVAGFQVIDEKEDTLSLIGNGIKLSFFRYPYPFIEERVRFEGVSLSGILDIASMKILAIVQRGTKRDFVDLFFVLQDVPFAKVARNMVARFGTDRLNPVVMGKALVHFIDADSNPDPNFVVGMQVDWGTIKKFFRNHVKAMVLELDQVSK